MSRGDRAQDEKSSLAELRRQNVASSAAIATGIGWAVYQREGHCVDRCPQNATWGNLWGSLALGWTIHL